MGISVWHGNGCNLFKKKVELKDRYEGYTVNHFAADCIMLAEYG